MILQQAWAEWLRIDRRSRVQEWREGVLEIERALMGGVHDRGEDLVGLRTTRGAVAATDLIASRSSPRERAGSQARPGYARFSQKVQALLFRHPLNEDTSQ